MTDLSLAIRSYNEEVYTGRLRTGIALQRLKRNEVIGVDSSLSNLTPVIGGGHFVRFGHIAKEIWSFCIAFNCSCSAMEPDDAVLANAR